MVPITRAHSDDPGYSSLDWKSNSKRKRQQQEQSTRRKLATKLRMQGINEDTCNNLSDYPLSELMTERDLKLYEPENMKVQGSTKPYDEANRYMDIAHTCSGHFYRGSRVNAIQETVLVLALRVIEANKQDFSYSTPEGFRLRTEVNLKCTLYFAWDFDIRARSHGTQPPTSDFMFYLNLYKKR